MGLFTKLAGIIGTTLQLDVVNGGPRSKNEAGAMAFRNAADSAYAIVRGDGTSTGANDLRPWASFTKSYWVDPLNGNDANSGTQASPFRSWNAGAWPAIAGMVYCDVVVTYVGTTTDASMGGGSYILPVGVRVTLVAPWADIGLGALTAAAGTTTTDIVVQGGGLAVNVAEGARIRVTGGALTGKVFSSLRNTATDIIPCRRGTGTALAAGDTFVVERPVGGWAPAASFAVDTGAAGCALRFRGFKIAPSAFVRMNTGAGKVWASGLYWESAATSSQMIPDSGFTMLGALEGGFFALPAAGDDTTLCCYFHAASGAPSVFFETSTSYSPTWGSSRRVVSCGSTDGTCMARREGVSSRSRRRVNTSSRPVSSRARARRRLCSLRTQWARSRTRRLTRRSRRTS